MNKSLPKHIAIIMDGNGRWAKRRHLPRIAGHRAGIEAVRNAIKICGEKGIEVLTLFAFSSENWQRPADEVSELMGLFLKALQREAKKLHKNNVQLRIIGDTARFNQALQDSIQQVQELTRDNTGLKLVIAANYGGQWDIVQAAEKIAVKISEGELTAKDISGELIQQNLVTENLPNPDLFIRTSGEQRISNFLIWQLAYTELFFTETLWPDFSEVDINQALDFYATRERRFGCTSEQLQQT